MCAESAEAPCKCEDTLAQHGQALPPSAAGSGRCARHRHALHCGRQPSPYPVVVDDACYLGPLQSRKQRLLKRARAAGHAAQLSGRQRAPLQLSSGDWTAGLPDCLPLRRCCALRPCRLCRSATRPHHRLLDELRRRKPLCALMGQPESKEEDLRLPERKEEYARVEELTLVIDDELRRAK
ncbi:hypothetical protein ABPG75_011042 [Micractinium tetrahymenae]